MRPPTAQLVGSRFGESRSIIGDLHADGFSAILEHGGDFNAAARELARQGYGERRESYTIDFAPDNGVEVGPSAEAKPDGKKRFELPPIYAWDEEEEEDWPRPPELVKGLLYQGAKGMIAGPSKARKTFALTDFAVSIASGHPWMGFPTTQVPVLYLNLELQTFAFRDRRQAIQQAKFGKLETIPLFTWHLRGYGVTLPMIFEQLLNVCLVEGIGCIVIDPTYKLNQSGEENAASDVGALLNQFEMVALKANAAVVFAHHFAKGNSGEKDAIDRASGSGVWARDPDTIITMNNHEKEDHMIVEMALRNFKKQDPFVIKWDYPLWTRATGEDTEAHKRKVGRPRKANVNDLKQVLKEIGEELVNTKTKDQIMAILKVGPTTLKNLWKELKSESEGFDEVVNEDPKNDNE